MTKRITRTLGIVAAICGLLTAFTGCDKEGLSHGGKAIKFTATTKSSLDTRTSYSGAISSGKERIDWKVDDVITIWSDNARVTSNASLNYSDYKITSVTADGAISKASITNAGANGLSFNNGESYSGEKACKFWAVYPSSVTINKNDDGEAIYESSESATIGFTAKMDQRQTLVLNTTTNKYEPKLFAKNAIMTAYVSGSYKEDDKIELAFAPAFTAYEVELKCAEGVSSDVTIQQFSINESAVSDIKDIVAVCQNGTWSYSVANPVTLYGTFPENVAVPAYSATNPLVFTVLAIPVANPASTSAPTPKITVKYTIGSEEMEKSLTLTGVTFAACKKHKLTGLLLPGNEWKITFAEDGMEVKEWISSDDNDQTLVVE